MDGASFATLPARMLRFSLLMRDKSGFCMIGSYMEAVEAAKRYRCSPGVNRRHRKMKMRMGGVALWRVRDAVRAEGMHAWAAGALIIGAVALRLLLIALGWPQTNSDESTMGLMALHIASGRDFPGFFYGQNYMGALQAYIAAPLFLLFGPSIFTLRLSMLLLCTGYLINIYLLTRLLYTKKLALVALVVVGLGTPETLSTQVTSIGGYGEVLCFGSGLLLIASWLALNARTSNDRLPRRRIVAFGAWGLVAGVGIWSDLLLLPFVAMSGLLLILWCRRELRQWRVSCLLTLAFVVGAFPLIAYNLTAAPGQDSFSVLLGIHQAGARQGSPAVLLGAQVAGTLLVSLPNITEAGPICPVGSKAAWPLTAQTSAQTIHCTIVRAGWSLGVIALWAIAVTLAFGALRALQRSSPTSEWSPGNRRYAALQTARLAVLGSAGLTLLLFALSSAAAMVPWAATRYLIGLLIAFPASLAALWPDSSYLFKLMPRAARYARALWASRYIPLALLALTLTLGTNTTFHLVAATQRLTRNEAALIANLQHIGATRIYSDYWTCNRLIFQSKERILCGVLAEDLQPGMNRYRPYYAAVRADSHAAYVFSVSSPQAIAFAARPDTNQAYRRFTFAGYVVYQPL